MSLFTESMIIYVENDEFYKKVQMTQITMMVWSLSYSQTT